MNLPALPGVYALHLLLGESCEIQVGCLGKFLLPPGNYLYFGSACGPGGLRGRLGRHLRGGRSVHWHIDSLRACAQVQGCYYLALSVTAEAVQAETARLECVWSQRLASLPGAIVPVPGFGASDCRAGCAAHLLAFPPEIGLLNVAAHDLMFEQRIQQALATATGVAADSVITLPAEGSFATCPVLNATVG